jgi:hypothetical protein
MLQLRAARSLLQGMGQQGQKVSLWERQQWQWQKKLQLAPCLLQWTGKQAQQGPRTSLWEQQQQQRQTSLRACLAPSSCSNMKQGTLPQQQQKMAMPGCHHGQQQQQQQAQHPWALQQQQQLRRLTEGCLICRMLERGMGKLPSATRLGLGTAPLTMQLLQNQMPQIQIWRTVQ